jgi:hypothetical protein
MCLRNERELSASNPSLPGLRAEYSFYPNPDGPLPYLRFTYSSQLFPL